jgi:hypothetical protein
VRLLQPIAEDEMIATFLRAEIDSRRYGGKLRELLARDGRELDVLRQPDLADSDANEYRRNLLEEHRAYERREGLFFGFPRHVEWFRAALEPDEVLDILYIDWDWWLDVSGGTRRPTDAARRIRAGGVPDTNLAEDEQIAAALRGSPRPPELIAVTTPSSAKLVLLEGHVRLTAYALFPDCLPPELEILLGISEDMARWSGF